MGPIGSMTVVNLSHIALDLLNTMLSILTSGMWASNINFIPRLCRCISASLTLYLSCSVGASCGIACTMILLEPYAPTFSDIEMPADEYCLYHCFNYAGSNGTSPLTYDYARRFEKIILQDMRRDGLSAQAARLLKLGAAGYPGEPSQGSRLFFCCCASSYAGASRLWI